MSRNELEFRLLGPVEVMEEGSPLELPPSKKARALLAYLIATGRPHGRSALCSLLWDDVHDPRAGLRWALSKLRPVVDRGEGRRIVTSRDRVEFVPLGAEVDLHRIRSAVPREPPDAPVDGLEEAARTFRGEFLEGLDLPERHEYQAWCLGAREGLRRQHLSILVNLVERLEADPDAALPHALARVRLDPFSEAAYIAAMEVLGRLGRVQRALELYEQCRRMLSDELGISPSPELRSARRRLRHPGEPGLPAAPPEGRRLAGGAKPGEESGRRGPSEALADLPPPEGLPEPGPEDPPLVGRAEELEILARIARGAGSRHRKKVVLITGEPGIGKTRLLCELVRQVRAAGGWALSGPVFESEEIRPYGPWIDLVRSLPEMALSRELERDLSALLTGSPPVIRDHGPAERVELFQAVARLLGVLAEARAPGLVVLDDVQWLDASSAALLHYAARTLTTAPLVFALAARESEIEEGSARARLLGSLAEEGLLRRTPLRRLDASETASLVQTLGTPVDPGRVFATSEGNPLFSLAIAGCHQEGSEWVPATLEEGLSRRLERLDRGALSLLPWAAALGRAFDVPALVHVVERPAAEIVESIDHLERRGILRPAGADRYDFTHSLLRRASYGRLSEPGRREVHRSIARALNCLDGPAGRMPAAVAHHAELGGLHEWSARACTEAAEHSLWLFAFDEAAELVERGLRQLENLPDEQRIPLETGLLRVYSFRSMRDRRPADVEERVRRATERARDAGLRSVVAVGHAALMELEYQRGAFKEAARSSVSAADAGRRGEPVAAIRALAETATCLLLLDQAPEDARRLASEAFALAEEHDVEVDVLPLARAFLHHHDGELEQASRAFQEVIRLGRRDRDRWWECPALTRMTMVELDRGDPEAALALALNARELDERLGDETEAAFARGLGGVAAERMDDDEVGEGPGQEPGGGDPPAGLAVVDQALGELRTLDSLWAIGHLQAYAAEVELDRGRPEAARERGEEVVRAARILEQPSLLAIGLSLLARSSANPGSVDGAVELVGSREWPRPLNQLSHRARHALQRAREVARR